MMALRQATEHRRASRTTVEQPGILVLDGDLALACAMRDVSDGGARIHLDAPTPLPAGGHFIDVHAGAAYRAKVVWRSGLDAGLELSEALGLDEAAPANMLRRTWLAQFDHLEP
ncbi:MAG: PilZ domain-containing protein [Caulobacteraceae bacterium]